jgi:CRP/FNR family transcriptional regulator, cyclic AMP receptor protein
MAKIRALRLCPLCRAMTYRDLAILAPFIKEETVQASEWLVVEGKPTSGLIILKSGKVKLTLTQNSTAQVDLGPGDFFGEFSLVDGDQIRAVGAKAVEDSQCLRLHPTDYHQLMAKAPGVAAKLAQGVLESMTDKMELTKELLQEVALEKNAN